MESHAEERSIDPEAFKKLAHFERRALLISADSRLCLEPSDKVYWLKLRKKRYLGYQRNKEVGQWRARVYHGGRYIFLNIGFADEGPKPQGRKHYTFREAVDVTTRFADDPDSMPRDRRTDRYPAFRLIASPIGSELTVLKIVSLYLASLEGRTSRGYLANLYRSFNRHIIPDLGNTLCDELTVPQIRAWFADLDVAPVRLSDPLVRVPGGPLFSEDQAEERQARELANRVMINFRSLMNFAWHDGLISGYERPWMRVRPYRVARRKIKRGLSQDECGDLVRSCPRDLKYLVLAALFTGARLPELRTLKRSAFDFTSGSLLVYSTKVRRARRVILSFEAIDFFEFLSLTLKPDDFLLRKDDGEPWAVGEHTHMFRQACLAAGIDRHVVFHDLRHTYASHQIMAGVSPFVIAEQLGHRDCNELYRTYGHVSTSFTRQQIRSLTPTYVLGEEPLNAVAKRHEYLAAYRRKPTGPMPVHIWFGQVADWSKPVY